MSTELMTMDPEEDIGVGRLSTIDELMKDLGVSMSNRRFAFRAAWYCIVSLFICYTLGWFGAIGLPSPFVRTTEFSKLSHEQLAIRSAQTALADDFHQERVDRLDARILALVSSRCASAEGSPARATYTQELEEVIQKYKRLTGEYPRVPDCHEISQVPLLHWEYLPAIMLAERSLYDRNKWPD